MMGQPELNRNEAAVYDELVRQGCALTAYELLDSVQSLGIRSPTQVYRALERLAERHLVHRVESVNAFIACTHAHENEPNLEALGFTICESCGSVNEIDLSSVEMDLDNLTAKIRFKVEYSLLEIRGKCQRCQTI